MDVDQLIIQALRVYRHDIIVNGRRNGGDGDPRPVERLLAKLVAQATQTGQQQSEYVTISEALGASSPGSAPAGHATTATVSARTIQRWAKSGRIRGHKIGNTLQIHQGDFEREIAK